MSQQHTKNRIVQVGDVYCVCAWSITEAAENIQAGKQSSPEL